MNDSSNIRADRKFGRKKCYHANIKFEFIKPPKKKKSIDLEEYFVDETKNWCETMLGTDDQLFQTFQLEAENGSEEQIDAINNGSDCLVLYQDVEKFVSSYCETELIIYVILDAKNNQFFIIGVIGREDVERIADDYAKKRIQAVRVSDFVKGVETYKSSLQKSTPVKGYPWWLNEQNENQNGWVSLYRRFTQNRNILDTRPVKPVQEYYKEYNKRSSNKNDDSISFETENIEGGNFEVSRTEDEDDDDDLMESALQTLEDTEYEFAQVSVDEAKRALRWRLKLIFYFQKLMWEERIQMKETKTMKEVESIFSKFEKFFVTTGVDLFSEAGRRLDELSFMLCRLVCCSDNDFKFLFLSAETLFLRYKIETLFPTEKHLVYLLEHNKLLGEGYCVIERLDEADNNSYLLKKLWSDSPFKKRQRPRLVFNVPFQQIYTSFESPETLERGTETLNFSTGTLFLEAGYAKLFYYNVVEWLIGSVIDSVETFVSRNISSRLRKCFDSFCLRNQEYRNSLEQATKMENNHSDNLLSNSEICKLFTETSYCPRLFPTGTNTSETVQQGIVLAEEVIKPFLNDMKQVALEDRRFIKPLIPLNPSQGFVYDYGNLICFPGASSIGNLQFKRENYQSGSRDHISIEYDPNDTGEEEEYQTEEDFEKAKIYDEEIGLYVLFPLCMRRLVKIAKEERHLKYEERNMLLLFLANIQKPSGLNNLSNSYLLSETAILSYWKFLCDYQDHKTDSRKHSLESFIKHNPYGRLAIALVKKCRKDAVLKFSSVGTHSYLSGMSYGCSGIMSKVNVHGVNACPFNGNHKEIYDLAKMNCPSDSAVDDIEDIGNAVNRGQILTSHDQNMFRISREELDKLVKDAGKTTYTASSVDSKPNTLCRRFLDLTFKNNYNSRTNSNYEYPIKHPNAYFRSAFNSYNFVTRKDVKKENK